MITVQVLGRMTKESEKRTFGSTDIVSFCLASDHIVKGEKVADFLNCKSFGKTGEVVMNHFHKGSRMFATGELTSRVHEGKTYWEMNVSTVAFVDARPEQKQIPPNVKKPVSKADDYSDTSLPFDL